MEDGQPVPGSLYVYAPNKVAPFFFIVAYAASAVGHIWQCHRFKAWKLIGLHPFCAVLFTAGYVLRAYGAFNYFYTPSNLLVYILSQVFIQICPPLLELANYHVLGRILFYVPHLAPLPPGRVLSIFGGLMMLVETLNALGVAFASNPSSSRANQEMGSRLTIAALVLQLGVIGTFVLLAGLFHRRCARAGILRARDARAGAVVSAPLAALYASMALILARCVYRLVEHAGGHTAVKLSDPASLAALNPVLRYEWYFYVFEATLMLLNSALWNVWHPGRYLPPTRHVHLARDGRTEVEDAEGARLESDRPLLAKAGSVMTFGILFRQKGADRTFEELSEYRGVSRQE